MLNNVNWSTSYQETNIQDLTRMHRVYTICTHLWVRASCNEIETHESHFMQLLQL